MAESGVGPHRQLICLFRTLGQNESEDGDTGVKHRLRTGRLICTAWGLGAWFDFYILYYFHGCLCIFMFNYPIPTPFIALH